MGFTSDGCNLLSFPDKFIYEECDAASSDNGNFNNIEMRYNFQKNY